MASMRVPQQVTQVSNYATCPHFNFYRAFMHILERDISAGISPVDIKHMRFKLTVSAFPKEDTRILHTLHSFFVGKISGS